MIPTEVVGSRLPVGSSAMRIIGRLTKARAIATRCCSPPESSSGIRSPLPSRPTISSVSGTSSAMSLRELADHLEREGDVLADRLVGEQPEVLEDGADVAAQPRHLPAGQPVDLLAGDVDAARGGAVLPQHEPQEGRLAGPGGADEEDELALLDVDRDLVERRVGVAGVGLGDLLEANHASRLREGRTDVQSHDAGRRLIRVRRRPSRRPGASGCRPRGTRRGRRRRPRCGLPDS